MLFGVKLSTRIMVCPNHEAMKIYEACILFRLDDLEGSCDHHFVADLQLPGQLSLSCSVLLSPTALQVNSLQYEGPPGNISRGRQTLRVAGELQRVGHVSVLRHVLLSPFLLSQITLHNGPVCHL